MSKVAHYLQEHITGEVLTTQDARQYFATDGSIFTITPSLVMYPQNENDIRKTARFTWQLAERGRVIPITCRGAGTDQGGAAIGTGIMMVFPAHMNRVIEFDRKSGVVVVEPGLNYGRLQQTLQVHSQRFIPAYPSSYEYSTIGGAVANNAGGEKSYKYGSTLDYVRGLRVVLANGEVIETYRLNKRELGKKLGLSSFEGEIYRTIDTLIEENKSDIENFNLAVTKNAAGYNLADVKRSDGSFDLTPLFVGSQGTLGIISEITLETAPYNPEVVLIAAYFETLDDAESAVAGIKERGGQPSAVEIVDGNLLQMVHEVNANQLKGIIDPPFPAAVLLIEYDEPNIRARKKSVKKAVKVLEQFPATHQIEYDSNQQMKLWKIRHASSTVIARAVGSKKAVPIIEDGIVPPAKFKEYLDGIYDLFASHRLDAAVWGHAGDANLHLRPFLDLGQVGDRQLAFKLMDEYYNFVLSLGGSTTAQHNDGRLRGPYLERLYGPAAYSLLQKIKLICDPYGILNPGVKIDVTLDSLRPIIRSEYSMNHLYDHLPKS